MEKITRFRLLCTVLCVPTCLDRNFTRKVKKKPWQKKKNRKIDNFFKCINNLKITHQIDLLVLR